jgi:hypothetical protein
MLRYLFVYSACEPVEIRYLFIVGVFHTYFILYISSGCF